MGRFRERAVTLIELLLVVIILGLLVSLAIPNYAKMIEASKGREAEATLLMIFEAEQEYAAHEGQDQYTNDLGNPGALIPKYLPSDPTDADWAYTIAPPPPTDRFTVTARRQTGGCQGRERTIDQTGALNPLQWPPSGCP